MNKHFTRGLVVGKFCPLHLGHEHVLNHALGACREVLVLSYTNPEFLGFEPTKRRAWLAARFPSARALVLDADDAIPPNDADDFTHRQFTARICLERFGKTVEAVFTSESYGDGFAAELSRQFGHPVTHVPVDSGRVAVPISGTLLRQDVHAHRSFLSPEVYASFVQRVAILGGESSGKSTLAATLAEKFSTAWVPEFGRELWDERGGHLCPEDMEMITRTQIAREEAAMLRANRFVFCDTTPLTTQFYSEAMFGEVSAEVRSAALRDYRITLLCEPDFPFVQDGTRQNADFRARQHAWYLKELTSRGILFARIGGSIEARLDQIGTILGFSISH
jgi:NadR type nicotinamide-nucleotide adenylyltransferase